MLCLMNVCKQTIVVKRNESQCHFINITIRMSLMFTYEMSVEKLNSVYHTPLNHFVSASLELMIQTLCVGALFCAFAK